MSPIRPENRDRYGTPAEWAAIREQILRRAGADMVSKVPRCECMGECGRGTHVGRCVNLHGGFAYGTGSRVVLTIAHLDHTPENNDPMNLRAMCQGCHLHYDREHHAETRAQTKRGKLAAAGQMEITIHPAVTIHDPVPHQAALSLMRGRAEEHARGEHGYGNARRDCPLCS